MGAEESAVFRVANLSARVSARRVAATVAATVLGAFIAPSATAVTAGVLAPSGVCVAIAPVRTLGAARPSGSGPLAAPAPLFRQVKTLDFASLRAGQAKTLDRASDGCGAPGKTRHANRRFQTADERNARRGSVHTVKTLD